MPLVSVVVPTHNRPEMLAEALASVRAQTFTDYEIIVVSNGEAPEIRGKSQAAATVYCCRYYALPDGNVSAARNFGVEQAKGEWIAFLDDDDFWPPSALADLASGSADMVSGQTLTFGSESKLITPIKPGGWSYAKATAHGKWYSYIGAILVRREAFVDVLFDPALTQNEDSDFWRRFSWRHSIEEIKTPVLYYRQGHESVSTNIRQRERTNLAHIIKMFRDTPSDLRWTLPSPTRMIIRWVLRQITPTLIRQPRKSWEAIWARRRLTLPQDNPPGILHRQRSIEQ